MKRGSGQRGPRIRSSAGLRGNIVKRTPKCNEAEGAPAKLKHSYKGTLAVALTAAVVIGCGLSMTGANSTAAVKTGGASAGDAVIDVQSRPLHCAYITGYPDGEVKPLGRITREEAAAIFYRLMTEERRTACAAAGQPFSDTTVARSITEPGTAQPFADVDAGRWSCNEIAVLYSAGILQGYPDGRFKPSSPVTRAEFAAMAARFDNLAETPENKFPDIENHWAVKYINSAAEKGWVRAYGDLTFRPENTIIRCEAMMWVNDTQNRIVNGAGLHAAARQWPDNTEDKWYYEIVLEASNTHGYERVAERAGSTEKWTGIEANPVWE